MVLPSSVVHNQYVYSHVHLQFAEVQHFLGFPIGRPETFFAYTNAWGSAFAILTPFAIASLTTTRNRRWRNILAISMFAAIVPVVFSLNRGLWLSLGVGIMYAAVRLSANRDFRLVRGIVGATICIVVLLVATPLGGLATSRFSHKTGDTGRLQRDRRQPSRCSPTRCWATARPRQNTVAGPEFDRHRVRGVPARRTRTASRASGCSSSGLHTRFSGRRGSAIPTHSGRTS